MVKYMKGKIVKATVTGIEDYGIFVALEQGYTGLIHISEISYGYVKNINKFVKIGDTILVEILDVDELEHRLKLSIKNINYRKNGKPYKMRIKETSLGFKTLAYNLPIWIEKNVKKNKKVTNSIDK